jgi:hypothetical protein
VTVTGMNLTEVQHLGQQLRAAGDQLLALVSDVDARVGSTTWVGHDAETFKHQWWPGHRQRLLDAAAHIHGLGQSAANNATEQEHASSRYGGTAPTSAHGASGPTHTPPTAPSAAHAPEPTVSPSSTAATGAVDWAQSQVGDDRRDGECLGFVGDAWSSKGVNYRDQIDPAYWRGNDTYPADIWGHFTDGTTGTDPNPPAGALVFYSGTPDHPRDYSHVTLSLGNGQAVSTADSVPVADNDKIHIEPVARPGRYLGWWLPAT